jgi:peptidoglycan/xylan/chitin deacetylase (PgdA/CDA1 family)
MSTYQRSAAPIPVLMRAIGDSYALWPARKARLCIVNYHRILEVSDPLLENEPDVQTFRKHMKMLADCFKVLPLDEALAALQQGRLPARAVCITFDDGYRSVHDLALPVLREFNLPATVFVSSGYVDSDENMWNDRIVDAVRAAAGQELDLRAIGAGRHPLDSLEARCSAVRHLTTRAKYLPPAERMALVEELEAHARPAGRPLMLSAEMVRTLQASGVEIGAHTVSHPILTSLPDADAMAEIAGSKAALEAILGRPVRYFAYPNGKTGLDFDERHVAMVRDAGFAAAFSTAPGPVTEADNVFTLPRSRPWDTSTFFYMLRLLRWLAS